MGIFTISLDFELAWGIYGEKTRAAYQENLLGARTAIPALLELFQKYEIHATWATVGFLHCEAKNELIQYLPDQIPAYDCLDISAYEQLKSAGLDEHSDPLHFASSLVKLIRTYPHQEIGTHTFSHYFCLEKGQNSVTFAADLASAKKIGWDKYHDIPKSLVFPRNQINENYLPLCQQSGITAYRGSPPESKTNSIQKKMGRWLYDPAPTSEQLLKRFFRLLDGYINLSGNHTYPLNEIAIQKHFFNIPASAFLQSYRKPLKLFEPLRMSRIKSALIYAAKNDEIYHLWFHPHQFGKNFHENYSFLSDILEYYGRLKKEYCFKSLNMGEISDLILRPKNLREWNNPSFSQVVVSQSENKVSKTFRKAAK